MRKQPITTKDLGILNELMIFEQWASTKFRIYYDLLEEMGEENELKELFKEICMEHSDRFDYLYYYLKANMKAGGSKK